MNKSHGFRWRLRKIWESARLLFAIKKPAQTPAAPSIAELEVEEGPQDQSSLSEAIALTSANTPTTLQTDYALAYNDFKHKIKALEKRDLTREFDIPSLRLPDSVASQPQSRELINRMKRYLPSFATTKATVMSIAALDTNKIAPICCAVLFTIVEVGPFT
jgi:hypothetical protein